MSKLLEGRVAIVTGAGRGIGREHALELARQGAKVVVNDYGVSLAGEGTGESPAEEVVSLIKGMGGEAVANGADVADFEQAGAMVQQAIDEFGGLDILVNNAGFVRDRMLVNATEDEWDAVSVGVEKCRPTIRIAKRCLAPSLATNAARNKFADGQYAVILGLDLGRQGQIIGRDFQTIAAGRYGHFDTGLSRESLDRLGVGKNGGRGIQHGSDAAVDRSRKRQHC